jgi:hypothetical protein
MMVTAGGVAEAPEGRADMNRLAFEDGSEAVLFSDTRSHLPLMVTWQGPDVLARLDAVEHRFYFSDFRSVGALRWPFVIRRAAAGQLIEELQFDRAVINPPVDLSIFDDGR